jgi:LacI family transcriptional regulator
MTLTLKEIAELAGVSRSTASRVLNDHPGVRPEVRERVLQVIREQSFQPDPAARSLASRRTAIIGAAQTAENRSSDHTA